MYLLSGALTACITDWVLGTESDLIFWSMFGGFILGFDVIFRAIQKDVTPVERWVYADGGGQFIVFPLWFTGIAAIVISFLYLQ